jgi:hypothetical protein
MPGRWIDWMFRSRETREITVAQMPNVPLVLFAACRITQALFSSHASVRDVLHWAGSAALAWWALDEIFRGVNPFRRLLGAAALASFLL